MFCAKCGTQVEDGVAFCPQCGNPVASQQQAAPQPTVQPTVQQGTPLQQAAPQVGNYSLNKKNPLMVVPSYLTLVVMLIGLFLPAIKMSSAISQSLEYLKISKFNFSWLGLTKIAFGIGDDIMGGIGSSAAVSGKLTLLLPILIIVLLVAYLIVEKHVSFVLHVLAGVIVVICAWKVLDGGAGASWAGIIELLGGLALVAEGVASKVLTSKN